MFLMVHREFTQQKMNDKVVKDSGLSEQGEVHKGYAPISSHHKPCGVPNNIPELGLVL